LFLEADILLLLRPAAPVALGWAADIAAAPPEARTERRKDRRERRLFML
jgi:hypothetical protein